MRLAYPFRKTIGLSCLLIVTSIPAYGYIDPGTGSLIIQSLIGAIAAIGVTMKLYWHKLKVFFSGRTAQPKVEKTQSEETSE